MKKYIRYLHDVPAKWRRRTSTERLLLLEAFALLGVARLLLLTVPFRWLAVSLGRHMQESAPEAETVQLRHARLVGQAVRSAANHTPWQSVCLPQAVAAQWMLKRRRIVATLYLGVAKTDVGQVQFRAHAWLRCGTFILTGAPEYRQFTVVASFS